MIPELERSPGGGHGNPLQYSCLENPMDRGAWWAAVHKVAQNQTRLKQLNSSTNVYCILADQTLEWPRLLGYVLFHSKVFGGSGSKTF